MQTERPIALVTGAARRVGRAIALELARAGCDVVITYRGSRSEAQSVVEELRSLGAAPAQTRAVMLDLGEPGEVERIGAELARELPRLDVLVHNASVYEPVPLEALTDERLLAPYRVHAVGPLVLTKHLAALLRRSTLPGGGAVLAMCDIHALGEHGLPRAAGYLAYALSKAAAMEMVRTLARELAPRVRVNAVAPGVVAWPEAGAESTEPVQRAYLALVPLERAGTPEDAARAVRFLALEAHSTTGQVLRIDGGRSLR